MKLKLDANGNVVVEDGKPVYIYDDGTEAPFDAKGTLDGLNGRIANLEDEKTRHFNTAKELKVKLKTFEGIDPTKARDALETVSNLDAQKILDANGVKALKAEMRSTFDQEKEAMTNNFNEALKERDGTINQLQSTVHNLVVTKSFYSSSFFTGDKPKTIYPPNDAAKIFGDHFSVEKDDATGEPRVIARDNDGKVILSRTKHGDPAGFDEAMSIIIDQHPDKNRFLRSPDGSGPPSRGNFQNQNGRQQEGVVGQSRIAAGLGKQYKDRFDNRYQM